MARKEIDLKGQYEDPLDAEGPRVVEQTDGERRVFVDRFVPDSRAVGTQRVAGRTWTKRAGGSTGEPAYAAAKGGVIAFTKSLAREVARHEMHCAYALGYVKACWAPQASYPAAPPLKPRQETATVSR